MENLVQVLEAAATAFPDKIVFVYAHDNEQEESITFGELSTVAKAIAVKIKQQLALVDEATVQLINDLYPPRVLLIYSQGLDFIRGFFGCLYAGTIAIPVIPPENRALVAKLELMVADTKAYLCLSTPKIFKQIQQFAESPVNKKRERLWGIDKLTLLNVDGLNLKLIVPWQEPLLGKNQLAFLQYTSGSTGQPKGVMLTHGNLLHNLACMKQQFCLSKNTRAVFWVPFHHTMGLVCGILQPVYSQFATYLFSPTAFTQKPHRWLRAITDFQASISGGPNFAYELCINQIDEEQKKQLNLRSWQLAVNGAEPLRISTLARFITAFASCGFNKNAFCPGYGLTENTLIATGSMGEISQIITMVDKHALQQKKIIYSSAQSQETQVIVSSGFAHPSQRVIIVDPERRTKLADEYLGEVWIKGESVAQGYWNHPQLTKELFQAKLHDGDGPYLRTGDLGFMHARELYVTGRLKDLIIIRGKNYYPQDIEATIEYCDPKYIRANSVTSFAIEVDNQESLVIVVELARELEVELCNKIFAKIREAVINEYGLKIYCISLILPNTVTKTVSGKVRRRFAKNAYLTNQLKPFYESLSNSWQSNNIIYQPPTTAGEKKLVQIWQQLFALPRIGVLESFFDLGGDSILLSQLQLHVREQFQVAMPLSTLYGCPTLSAMAMAIEQELNRDADLPKQISRSNLSVEFGKSRPDHLPLSFAQQRLWFLDEFLGKEGNQPVYNIPAAIKLTGRLNFAALQQAFTSLIKRHESLRTIFQVLADGQAVQVIMPATTFKLAVVDFSQLSLREQESKNTEFAKDEALKPFDLSKGPLLRGQLLYLAKDSYVLLVTIHHIIADGWSMGVLARELAHFYNNYEQKTPLNLPPLTIQYADFALWQRRWLQDEVLSPQLAYWRKQLKYLPESLDLPTDRPRPKFMSYKGGSIDFSINDTLLSQLKALSLQQNVTLFMTLLAALQILLYRFSGQEDIVVGSPIANRTEHATEDLIGFFVNTLALRSQVRGKQRFIDLLAEVKETALAAFEHKDVPFEQLVEHLKLRRDTSRSPLFQVMMVLQNNAPIKMALTELKTEFLTLPSYTAKFDLTLLLQENASGALNCQLEYAADLYELATIQRLSEHWQVLLTGIVVNPWQKVSLLPLLTDTQKYSLLVEWNHTKVLAANNVAIQQLFEEQVTKTPDQIAVVFANQQLTYRKLNHEANKIALYLRSLQVKPDLCIALSVERSQALIIGLLGILKAGAAYLFLDPKYPAARIRFMLADANVKILICNLSLKKQFAYFAHKIIILEDLLTTNELTERNTIDANNHDYHIKISSPVTPSDQEIPVGDAHHLKTKLNNLMPNFWANNPAPLASANNLAYVIYTSGSTGKPKGVLLEHHTLTNLVRWQSTTNMVGISKVMQFANLGFDVSLQEIFYSLVNGYELHIIPDHCKNSIDEVVNFVSQEKISCIFLPTALLDLFAMASLAAAMSFPALKEIIVAGEVLKITAAISNFFRSHKSIVLINHYGPSETHVVAAYKCNFAHDSPLLPPIGKPIFNSQIYILDASLQPVPIGVIGELYIGGAGVAREYLNQRALTTERFIVNPFISDNNHVDDQYKRLYRTGDLATFMADGNIKYLGRIDNQVKIRGFRIECGEIEHVLAKFTNIKEVAVIGRQDLPGEKYLVAYIVWQKGASTTDCTKMSQEVRQYLAQHLPEYMIPKHYVFLSQLPLSPNGKLDNNALPLPTQIFREAGSFSMPQTSMEQEIAKIWAELLNIPLANISVNDDFFYLGGHSLLAVQVIYKIRELVNFAVPIKTIFSYPTIKQFTVILPKLRQNPEFKMQQQETKELLPDVYLEESIQPKTISSLTQLTNINILLTGATGFLGAFLLCDLLDAYQDVKVYCLVRADSREHGMARLVANLHKYNLTHADLHRVIPVLGELTKPNLGLDNAAYNELATMIAVVFHNGALINHTYTYAQHYAVNVYGTQEMLKFVCTAKIKIMHYVSTVGVLMGERANEESIIFEDASLDKTKILYDGYSQSKWVAEKIIALGQKRGIPINIYRPGHITGHSKTGVCNPDDFLSRIIIGCAQLGLFPENAEADFTPIDYVSSAIVNIAQNQDYSGKSFHIINTDIVKAEQLIENWQARGFKVDKIPYNTWVEALFASLQAGEHNVLHAYLSLLDAFDAEKIVNMPIFDCTNTINVLNEIHSTWIFDNNQLLNKQINYLQKNGFMGFSSALANLATSAFNWSDLS